MSLPLTQKRKRSILIVEDVQMNFLLLKKIIERIAKFDCDIVRAENGKIAVDYCSENSDLDLIFMDIEMPIMNGFEATLAIKKKFPYLPIIVQTAYTSEENRRKAMKAGSNDFITKPIRMDHIEEVLSRFIPVSA